MGMDVGLNTCSFKFREKDGELVILFILLEEIYFIVSFSLSGLGGF